MVFSHALLSRPEPQLTELAGRVQAVGLKPVCIPAFDFTATNETVVPDVAWNERSTRVLVFTSPRAVEFGLPALQDTMLANSQIVSVGPATTRALAAAGLQALQAPGPVFDSDALLACVKSLPEPGAAVILAAPGGREAIQTGLEATGWQVRLVPVYRRNLLDPGPASVTALEAAQSVLSIWTSGTALKHVLGKLSEKAGQRVRAGTAIVVSGRLREVAAELGLEEVRQSGGASNDELLKAIKEVVG